MAFIDELRRHGDEHVLVLIPVVRTDRLHYRLLHNHVDIVLTMALRTRTDMVVARVGMPLQLPEEGTDPSHP